MNKGAFITRWIFAAVFLALGLFFSFALVGYGFLGTVCFGVSLVLCVYNLLALLQKQRHDLAKALRLILSCILILALIASLVTGIIIGQACSGSKQEICQYVLVLGCGVNGTEPSRSLQDRIDAAYAYLLDHPDVICIVSGGKGDGENLSEAQCMFNELTELGIDPERIWMEDQATSTRENFQFTMNLIQAKTGARPEKIAVVSSEYHLYRAGMFGREQNVQVLGVPAKTSYPVLFVNYFLREIVMVWYYSTIGAIL